MKSSQAVSLYGKEPVTFVWGTASKDSIAKPLELCTLALNVQTASQFWGRRLWGWVLTAVTEEVWFPAPTTTPKSCSRWSSAPFWPLQELPSIHIHNFKKMKFLKYRGYFMTIDSHTPVSGWHIFIYAFVCTCAWMLFWEWALLLLLLLLTSKKSTFSFSFVPHPPAVPGCDQGHCAPSVFPYLSPCFCCLLQLYIAISKVCFLRFLLKYYRWRVLN